MSLRFFRGAFAAGAARLLPMRDMETQVKRLRDSSNSEQIKHLNELISLFCYGGAIVGSVVAGYLVLQLP